MNGVRVLIIGGGDVGSAIAHVLFRSGFAVLISERQHSAHARRGMAYTDALFDGSAVLDGVEARWLPDVASVQACWDGKVFIPVVTVPEAQLATAIRFDAVVDATMRRNRTPPDLRSMGAVAIGVGPGYAPGVNCDVAIESQWGESMGRVLRDSPAAERSGGPRPLDGVGRERFVVAPVDGLWRSPATIGQFVNAGDELGQLAGRLIAAPISGYLRGISHDGVVVARGQILLEVDPRATPQIHGMGERPAAIARGVAEALDAQGDAVLH